MSEANGKLVAEVSHSSKLFFFFFSPLPHAQTLPSFPASGGSQSKIGEEKCSSIFENGASFDQMEIPPPPFHSNLDRYVKDGKNLPGNKGLVFLGDALRFNITC